MGLTVVQECPQCGAPIELDETHRLLRCPYCDVNSFLFADRYFRFVLPPKTPRKDLIYLPYLRFRGSVFSCHRDGVRHRIMDITHLSVPFKRVPVSLGLRPQAMKMRFVKADTEGTFLKCLLKTEDLLARAEKHAGSMDSVQAFHRAYIGDTTSLIYLPMYVEGEVLFDAITARPMAGLPRDRDIFSSIGERNPGGGLTFLATICPGCGWNLEGEQDSVVLTCSNCETAWEAKGRGFVKVDVLMGTGGRPDSDYLPFWSMTVEGRGVTIRSYGDFMRITNQPRVIRSHWENRDMIFFSPAFKIRPKLFLFLSQRLTLGQPQVDDRGKLPAKGLYPATLPLSEAVQGIKVTLAGCVITRKKIMPLLPRMGFAVRKASLVYLPFHETAHEMINSETGVGINKKALEFGRYL